MATREIYFAKDNQLYMYSVEVNWDNESNDVNKKYCSDEIFSKALPFMQPCVDVSTASGIYRCKTLSPYYVVDSNGTNVHDLWSILDKHKDRDFLPPGSYDLIYLMNLNKQQVEFALSKGSFYDIYYNRKKKVTSNAKALAMLQLLYQQNKLDYIYDMSKFLYWYMINGNQLKEWTEYYENGDK